MSDNVSIKEGSRAFNFTVDKLRTAKQGSDEPVIWVPESTVHLGSLRASDNGVYLARSEDLYGYGEIVVSVNGAATIGDRSVFPDENGELHEEYLPHAIVIVTPPRKLEYEDGQRIDLRGLVVKAVDAGGNTWTNAKYPNGHIPLGELIIDPDHADASSGEGVEFSDGSGINAIGVRFTPTVLHSPDGARSANAQSSGISSPGVVHYYDTPMPTFATIATSGNTPTEKLYLLTKYNGQVYAATDSSSSVSVVTSYWLYGGQNPTYYYYQNSISVGVSDKFDVIGVWDGYPEAASWDVPESDVFPGGKAFSDMYSVGLVVNVRWRRYGDGKELSTKFHITVTTDDGFSGGSGNF